MRLRFTRFVSLIALLAAAASSTAQNVSAQTFQGPSSSQTPYVVPSAPGWAVASLITTGDFDKAGTYRMVGIPDGLGAVAGRFRNGRYVADKSYMTVFMNHEIPAGAGCGARPRAERGVRLAVDHPSEFAGGEARAGSHPTHLRLGYSDWSARARDASPSPSSSRLCSADLPAFEAFYNPKTGKGFNGRLFMDGEEAGNEGRAFAHVLTGDGKGDSYQLPHLGRFSWENSVAHPDAGDKTIVVGTDDSTPGQVYVYIGQKTAHGESRGARRTRGRLALRHQGHQWRRAITAVAQSPRENNGAINGAFVLQGLGDVSATHWRSAAGQ